MIAGRHAGFRRPGVRPVLRRGGSHDGRARLVPRRGLKRVGRRLGHPECPHRFPGDGPGARYYEIPLVVQDRSFDEDGSLFYPDSRAFFEGLSDSDLRIPYIPRQGCTGPSDVSRIWNPEVFGKKVGVLKLPVPVPVNSARLN